MRPEEAKRLEERKKALQLKNQKRKKEQQRKGNPLNYVCIIIQKIQL